MILFAVQGVLLLVLSVLDRTSAFQALNSSEAYGVGGEVHRQLALTTTFSYTGSYQSVTVPTGVSTMTMQVYGAGGGSDSQNGYTCTGGNGAYATGTISVTAGSVYYIYVGGQGGSLYSGFNGGGTSGNSYGTGGNGATDVRTVIGDYSSRIIVAGGGGGCYANCGSSNGGVGSNGGYGGTSGSSGVAGCNSGGSGATQSSGGSGGNGGGSAGSFGQGGSAYSSFGGGGGGGYYGGGGGSWSGGGGGSSYVPSGGSVTDNSNSGNGLCYITFNFVPTYSPTFVPTFSPTVVPSIVPSLKPSLGPTCTPTLLPSLMPTVCPSVVPSVMPSLMPTVAPSVGPTVVPTAVPTMIPTAVPTNGPSRLPSVGPTVGPSVVPSSLPTLCPTVGPTPGPSLIPTVGPTVVPSTMPTVIPTVGPTVGPSANPSVVPSLSPSTIPTLLPTAVPTRVPTLAPSVAPTAMPSIDPTVSPSLIPSLMPSSNPSLLPSIGPSILPSLVPTLGPTALPTFLPTAVPTTVPSEIPTVLPSTCPSVAPSALPTVVPTYSPSLVPTVAPSTLPSVAPSTTPSDSPSKTPTLIPSTVPTGAPSHVPTSVPSEAPSSCPTVNPSTLPSTPPSSGPTEVPSGVPSVTPTTVPSVVPSAVPTAEPTLDPSTFPTAIPTIAPSASPSTAPTAAPSAIPTVEPSMSPTAVPTAGPTAVPSSAPTISPSEVPTAEPSIEPTAMPTLKPSDVPTALPSDFPTDSPTFRPSQSPSCAPSSAPSDVPSVLPSNAPSGSPSDLPTVKPSEFPSTRPSETPTVVPTVAPSTRPSGEPSSGPTTLPSAVPSNEPSVTPSGCPTSVPTIQPSQVPSEGPSSGPSFVPSAPPTVAASALPSVKPTAVPSQIPTTEPSGRPVLFPSGVPSAVPTVEASGSPSASGPSLVPSMVPVLTPSVLPTDSPSVATTCCPSMSPSVVSSELPSTRPSIAPTTSLPSMDPSVGPSLNPTAAPTLKPSIAPTAVPSVTPTKSPSRKPSVQPTLMPTDGPTATAQSPTLPPRSKAPSAMPTSSPSVSEKTLWTAALQSALNSVSVGSSVAHQSKYVELNVMQSHPHSVYGSCSSFTSLMKGDVAQSSVAYRVSSMQLLVSETVSGSVSMMSCSDSQKVSHLVGYLSSAHTSIGNVSMSCDGHQWIGKSCAVGGSYSPAVCVDCVDPCSVSAHCAVSSSSSVSNSPFTVSPCVSQVCTATEEVSAMRVLAVSFEDLEVAPDFVSLSSSASKTSISVSAKLSGAGTMYCGLYASSSGYQPSSVDEIVLQNVVGATDRDNSTSVTLSGLSAMTSYSVYCLTSSSIGVKMTLDKMLSNQQGVSTQCCKTVTTALSTTVFREKSAVSSLVSVALSAVPSGSLTATISCRLSSSSDSSTQLLFPNSFSFSMSALSGQSSVYSLPAGVYEYSVVLTGSSASEYEVVYSSGKTFTVLSVDEAPPAPKLMSAVFAGDGSYLTIAFDSSTNKGGVSASSFMCSSLFDFACSSTSRCQWTDSATVQAQITESVVGGCAAPKSPLLLRVGATIKPACPAGVSSAVCGSWQNATTSSPVIMQGPVAAVSPSVVISAPGVIGACDSLVLDITSSSGSGGRQWSNRSFVVQSNDVSGGNSSAVVQHFLNTEYQLSPPSAIASRMLSVGSTYNFVVTLCNFLGKCSQNNAKVVVLNTILPSVTLPGQTIRTMTRNSALSIGSSAFVASCSGGGSSSAGLTYQWTVSENGVVSLGAVSSSKDPSKMLLPAYSLSVNSLYQMSLMVTVSSSLQSSSASVKVLIVPGNVVARVSGGSSRSVRVGESVTVDASNSYDEDVDGVTGLSAGLVFTWSCSQNAPVYSASCASLFAGAADMSSVSADSLTLVALTQSVSVDETVSGIVVVTVQDGALKRSSSASVTVSLLTAAAPVVSLVSNQASGVVNADQRLQLTGSVSLPAGMSGDVSWSVVDSSFDLTGIALAPLKSYLSSGSSNVSHPVFMAFAANALPVGSSLTFMLTCVVPAAGTTSSSLVTISVNAPPQLGSFQVSPESGVALAQPFTFAASQWVDSNLPITYQFGYYANSGAYVVMQTQSLTSFGSSFMSAGLDSNGNKVTCVAQVFDSLNANTSVSDVIIVTAGKMMNSSEMTTYVSRSLSDGLTNADSIKQAMALSSYVLNVVDCSGAPDCSGLNRQQCYKTVNTCGSCVSPFIGVSGDSNSQCVSSAVREGGSDDECSAASDCRNAFAECVGGHCVVPNKQCINDCSGHGSCVLVNSTSSVELTSCSIVESQCAAVCKCDSEYSLSSACDLTNAEVEANQASKELVLNSIVALAGLEDPSEQVVSGWTSSVSIATLSTDQLSVAGTATALDIVSTVIGTASQLSLSMDAVGGLLGTMDSITTAVAVQIKNNRTNSANSTVSQIESVLSAYTSHAASSLVPGMSAVSSSHDQFSLSTQYMSASATMTLPVSSLDALNGVGGSSVSLPAGSATVAVSVVSVHSNLYAGMGSSGGFVSNPVSLMLSGLPCAAPPCEVNIVLQNNVAVTLEAGNVERFNTSCALNKPRVFDHECLDGTVMHLSCSGESDYIMHSQCPLSVTSQVCSGLSGSTASVDSGCKFVSQSSTDVTCSCLFGNAGGRRLQSSNETGGVSASADGSYSASYVAMLSTTVKTFVNTFESAGHLNNNVARKGWKAIVTIGVLACAIMIAIVLSHKADKREVMAKAEEKLAKAKSMSQKWKIVPEKPVRKTMFNRDKVNKVVNLELALVEQSLPKVLSSSMSITDRFKSEVKKHHRWFGVIFFYSDSFPRSFRVASLATNVIIMLFIQSITYNLTNPDDGSCAALSHTSGMACEGPRSSFATGQSKCLWDANTDNCSFIEPDGSIKIVLFVAIFSAIISTPIALTADWIMRNMVSAPVENVNAVAPLRESGSSRAVSQIVGSPLRSAEPASLSPRGTRRARFTMFPGGEAKKRAEHSLVSASHMELTKLTGEIRKYREGLTLNERQEFDLLWGLDEHGCFLTGHEHDNDTLNKLWRKINCFAKSQENKDVNVHQTVLADLKRIGAQTEDEIDTFTAEIGAEGQVSQMSKETKQALSKRLLFLFQCDLLPGISGQILSSKGSRDYVTVKPVTLFAKVVGWSTVLLLNVGMLFYILLFALSQTDHRQSAWFQSFILWLIVEILFVSTAIVFFTHIFIPMLAMKDVTKIKQRLLDNIREFHSKMAKKEHMDANERAAEDALKPFNAAQYLFVSSRVAARFPEVKEAQIISQFSTPWPRQSYQHVVDVSKNYNKKFSALSRSASVVLLFFMTSLLNVPPNFQDMIIQMVTTTSVGYTILLHIQLFDIFPVLAFGPFLVLCLLVHFWIRSGKAAAKAKLAKLMPSPVVQNRKRKDDAKVDGKLPGVTPLESEGFGNVEDDDLQIEIDLKLPEVEDLVVADDTTWKNFGSFVYQKDELFIPSTPMCEPSVGRGHVTRRQSVAHGVQLLHQMKTEASGGFEVVDDSVGFWNPDLTASGMNRVASLNSLEYDDQEELHHHYRGHPQDGKDIDDSELNAVSPMSFGDEL